MSADPKGDVGAARLRYRLLWALATSCYVLAVIVGMFFVADDFGPLVQIPLWIAHGVLLVVFIKKLGAKESSSYAAVFIVFASASAAHVVGMARDDLTLQGRGEQVTATVVKERLDPPQGRKGRLSHYTLEHQDGTRVPGPEMQTTSDLYDVGQVLTVVEDPDGDLAPQTPGQADATAELLGAGALALAALGSVAWMTRRGCIAVREAGNGGRSAPGEQEERLREALRTYPADRRGYIKVPPEEFPDVSHGRAARIAWEMGLRAEATGNRGSWRFGETVVEEVPHD
ncbi:hypothetical protein [Streptomyces sp. NPDC052114]|uniref:hypothetical protein n=1 Tax=unclassified Streptomyces TaxID=2593676 RepID=UPI003432D0A4